MLSVLLAWVKSIFFMLIWAYLLNSLSPTVYCAVNMYENKIILVFVAAFLSSCNLISKSMDFLYLIKLVKKLFFLWGNKS